MALLFIQLMHTYRVGKDTMSIIIMRLQREISWDRESTCRGGTKSSWYFYFLPSSHPLPLPTLLTPSTNLKIVQEGRLHLHFRKSLVSCYVIDGDHSVI